MALCLVKGEVFAIDNICSHASALLSNGYLEGHELFCPLHGGSFDVRTGEAVAAPCTVDLKVVSPMWRTVRFLSSPYDRRDHTGGWAA